MTICILAQMMAALANSHHDAKITAIEMLTAAQWVEQQCKAEQEKAEKDAKKKK